MDPVQRMLEQVSPLGRPPIDQWHPELSGDIDIRIDSEGKWFHEGTAMERLELVKLFASILRFEPDCGYVLVTPVEKWRIQVEDVPFIITAMSASGEGQYQALRFITSVGEELELDSDHPVTVRDGKPYVYLRDELEAKLSRPVYYQLVDLVVEGEQGAGVWSKQCFFALE